MPWSEEEHITRTTRNGQTDSERTFERHVTRSSGEIWRWAIGGLAAIGVAAVAMQAAQMTEGSDRPAVERSNADGDDEAQEHQRESSNPAHTDESEEVATEHPYQMIGTDGKEFAPANAFANVHINADRLKVGGNAVPITAALVVNGIPTGTFHLCDGATCDVLDAAIAGHGGGGGMAATGTPSGEGLNFPIPSVVKVDGVAYPVPGHATLVVTPEGGAPLVFAIPTTAPEGPIGDPE